MNKRKHIPHSHPENDHESDFRHPEVLEGEEFLGNCTAQETEKLKEKFTTIRIGETAYDADFRKLAKTFKPVFVMERELNGTSTK